MRRSKGTSLHHSRDSRASIFTLSGSVSTPARLTPITHLITESDRSPRNALTSNSECTNPMVRTCRLENEVKQSHERPIFADIHICVTRDAMPEAASSSSGTTPVNLTCDRPPRRSSAFSSCALCAGI